MRPVVSDAGPIHYLVLIEAIDCLRKQFGHVLIPEAVAVELSHPATPAAVRDWLQAAPTWLERCAAAEWTGSGGTRRGAGERAAIGLAHSIDASLLLIDDRVAAASARARGLETIGTIGVVVRAGQLGLLDLRGAFSRLRATNFRCRPELLDVLLARHEARRDD